MLKILNKIKGVLVAVLLMAFAGPPIFARGQVPVTAVLELRADPSYFSPNDDGFQDQAFFYPVIQGNGSSDYDVIRWRMEIRTARGKRMQRLSGPGLPSLIKWDGTGKKSQILEEGDYQASLEIWLGKGKMESAPVAVHIDFSPPITDIAVSTPVFQILGGKENSLVFFPEVKDDSPIESWQFQILDSLSRSVYVEWSTHTLHPLNWNGRNRLTGVWVPKGEYHGAFVAWDRAGNESLPGLTRFRVEVSAQQMLEKEVLNALQVIETDMGLLAQIPATEIFQIVKNRPEFSEKAEAYLKELAILINAYPKVEVQIDGYSWALKSASADMDRSSRYGWQVYSHLVKKGNVKASRLKVKGRGRSPMFDRRSLGVDLMGNGVEVILLGNRDWSK